MPLPPPADRERLHTRKIVCEGFWRQDGLWDIDAHLIDTKSYALENHDRGTLAPGTPLHEMRLRLTLDDAMVVRDVVAVTEAGPFHGCGAITPAFKVLIGMEIGAGWRRKVTEALGGIKGCTHLVELLGPMATVAFQTMWSRKAREKRSAAGKAATAEPAGKPAYIDGCHVLASDGPVVREHHARWYTGPAPGKDQVASASKRD